MGALLIIGLLLIVPMAIMFDKIKEKNKQNDSPIKGYRQSTKDQNDTPAKGCLQSSVEFGVLSIFLMLAVIICIMLLIASGN